VILPNGRLNPVLGRLTGIPQSLDELMAMRPVRTPSGKATQWIDEHHNDLGIPQRIGQSLQLKIWRLPGLQRVENCAGAKSALVGLPQD